MITTPCPECGSLSTAVKKGKSRLCSNGSRRRRYTCRDCNHKWTTYDGPAPPRNRPRKNTTPCPECGSLYARTIDMDRCSNQSIRRRLECISCGCKWTTYEGPPPLIVEEQRAAPTDGITCMQCVQWLHRCGLDIPEATIEGPTFAAECPTFIHSTPQSLSHE